MLAWGFAVHLNPVELLGLVIEKTEVAYPKPLPCVVVKVTCGVASFQIETPKDIDDFTIRPTHRSNLGVGWSRGSNSRYREPKEVFGHGKGKVKSIPKADRRIGKRVSQIVLKDVWKIHTTWLR